MVDNPRAGVPSEEAPAWKATAKARHAPTTATRTTRRQPALRRLGRIQVTLQDDGGCPRVGHLVGFVKGLSFHRRTAFVPGFDPAEPGLAQGFRQSQSAFGASAGLPLAAVGDPDND